MEPKITSSEENVALIGSNNPLTPEDIDPRSWTSQPLPGERSPKYFADRFTRSKSRRAVINVGGERHEILWESLSRYPQTRLGQLAECWSHQLLEELCDDYSLVQNEYFFDRQSRSFSALLNLYRKDRLHLPKDLCVLDFADDLAYWGIDEEYIDTCCQVRFQQEKDQLKLQETIKADADRLFNKNDFGKGKIAEFQKMVWNLFEKSVTIPQRITGILSMLFIVISVITLSLSTVPEFQRLRCTNPNVTVCQDALHNGSMEASPVNAAAKFKDLDVVDDPLLDQLELYCIIWFTFEYFVRLLTAPSKRKFFKGWLNNIDLLAIAPFYVSLFLVQFDTTPGRLLKVLRIFRIMRIFKLARHSAGLQSLGFTLRHSHKNLGVLVLFLSVGVVIFSTLAYFAEREDNEDFRSIVHACYWSLITMTTVGYGDVTPVTVLGKIVGMICSVCGVIVIALPISMIVNNFGQFYDEQQRKAKYIEGNASEPAKGKERSNYLPITVGRGMRGGSVDKDVKIIH